MSAVSAKEQDGPELAGRIAGYLAAQSRAVVRVDTRSTWRQNNVHNSSLPRPTDAFDNSGTALACAMKRHVFDAKPTSVPERRTGLKRRRFSSHDTESDA